MFRAQIHQLSAGPTLRMEGRLVGIWAEQVGVAMTNGIKPKGLVVDLTEITYGDSVGEQVLAWFASIGILFAAEAGYAAELCERLQLPLQRKMTLSAEIGRKMRPPSLRSFAIRRPGPPDKGPDRRDKEHQP